MTCSLELRKQGLPYPRTCAEHGLKCPGINAPSLPMTVEQMIYAAEQTLDMACRMKNFHNVENDPPELSYDHLTEMIIMMRQEHFQDDPGKVGRFLGFIQAAVIACPDSLRLKDFMRLNKQIIEGTYRE